jgi:hypothetical protein
LYFFDNLFLKSVFEEIVLACVASIIAQIGDHFSNPSIEVQSQVHFAQALSKILSIKYSFSLNSSFFANIFQEISNKYEFNFQLL